MAAITELISDTTIAHMQKFYNTLSEQKKGVRHLFGSLGKDRLFSQAEQLIKKGGPVGHRSRVLVGVVVYREVNFFQQDLGGDRRTVTPLVVCSNESLARPR